MIRRYGPFLAIAALIAIIAVTGTWRHVELDELQRRHAQLRAFVRGNPAEALAAYFGVYVIMAAACLPGIGLASIAGGYLFGAVTGGAVGSRRLGHRLDDCLRGGAQRFRRGRDPP